MFSGLGKHSAEVRGFRLQGVSPRELKRITYAVCQGEEPFPQLVRRPRPLLMQIEPAQPHQGVEALPGIADLFTQRPRPGIGPSYLGSRVAFGEYQWNAQRNEQVQLSPGTLGALRQALQQL